MTVTFPANSNIVPANPAEQLVFDFLTNRLIVSEGTVKAHVRQILRKLKAANRAEAVSRYTRMLHGRS
jgi:Bacterial regulatory proteins, luxR family